MSRRNVLILFIGIWPLVVFLLVGLMSDYGTVGISEDFRLLPWLELFLTVIAPVLFVWFLPDTKTPMKIAWMAAAVFYTYLLSFFLTFGLGCPVFGACL